VRRWKRGEVEERRWKRGGGRAEVEERRWKGGGKIILIFSKIR